MRQIDWTDEGRADIRRAVAFIAEEEPAAAQLVRDRVHRAVALLAEMPTGHPGRVSGTYEKVVRRTSYIVAYALSDQAVTILHVIHDKREWLPETWPTEE